MTLGVALGLTAVAAWAGIITAVLFRDDARERERLERERKRRADFLASQRLAGRATQKN